MRARWSQHEVAALRRQFNAGQLTGSEYCEALRGLKPTEARTVLVSPRRTLFAEPRGTLTRRVMSTIADLGAGTVVDIKAASGLGRGQVDSVVGLLYRGGLLVRSGCGGRDEPYRYAIAAERREA